MANGTPVITYTLPTGCTTTTVVTVNTSPVAITGNTTICAGLTSQLTDAVSGGVWSSNTSSVATVNPASGLVKAVSGGTTTITYAIGNCSTSILVTVNPAATAITGTLTVCAGLTTQLSDGVAGGTWASSDVSLATVGLTTGLLTGVGAGTPEITYTLPTGCTTTTVVTVNTAPDAITGITTICAGLTSQLTDAVSGGVWTSSSTTVATINAASGLVNAVSGGTTTITYKIGTCSTTRLVTVSPAATVITGTTTVCAESSTQLSDGVAGGTWSSSDVSLATVGLTTGLVTGVGAGTPVITYTLPTGCMTTTVVTVDITPTPITGITTICSGLTSQLSDGVPGGIWSSSDATVATIDPSGGLVTGETQGPITITYALGSCTASVLFNVNQTPTPITGTPTVCAGATNSIE